MESSEDDAGTATSASCGASARETDDGKSEDVDPTPGFQHESSEARMSCSTPTMSEDNFDGDSVPSPSAQDVNTSTEAILDMIDEFVDGPGAPKRLSLVSNNQVSTESTSNNDTLREPEPPPSDEQNVVQTQESSPAVSTEAENDSESAPQMSTECTFQSVVPDCANTGGSSSVSSPSTDTVQVREVESYEQKSADLEIENETLAVPTLSSSPSSSVQTVQDSIEVRNVEYESIQETESKSPNPDTEKDTVPDQFVSNSPSSSENVVQESVQVRNIESHSTQQVKPKSSPSNTENETAVVPSVPSSPSCSEQTQDPVQIGNIETHSTLPSEPRSSDLDTETETVTAPSVSISSSDPGSTETETVTAPSVSISSSEPRSLETETVTAPSVSISSSDPRSSETETVTAPSVSISSSDPRSLETETVTAPSVSISSSEPRSSEIEAVTAPSVSISSSDPRSLETKTVTAASVSISSSEPRSSETETVTAPSVSMSSSDPRSLETETVTAPSVSLSSSEPRSSEIEAVTAPSVSISSSDPRSLETETVTAPSVSISSSEPRSSETETVTAPSVSISSSEPRSSEIETVTAPSVSISSSEPRSLETETVTALSVSISSSEPRSSETETVTPQLVSISSSSCEQSVQNVSDSSDCNRTVKIVTSSDIRDCVTVERAESTSSECSVTESRCLVAEPATRMPLRRRLVRPVPSDRRPDSTVSSTVDSQAPNVNIIPQTSSEVIMKDVSSSSDAVPSGNTKPEEISNVSEISICKAETSSTPSKKIKLIRPKITPVTSNRSKKSDVESGVPCKDQCQSTSSDNRSMLHEVPAPSLSTVQEISKPQNDNSKPEIQLDVVNHNEIVATPEVHIVGEKSNKLAPIDIKPSIDVNSEVEQSSSDAQIVVNTSEKDSKVSLIDHDKKVPPIKLSAPKAPSVCKETLNEPKIDEKSDINNKKKDQKTLIPEKMNCDQDLSKQKSIDVPCEGKKVPPIKLNLSASDTDVQSTPKSSPQEDGPECSKQVPKLTIKLGNKQSEEAKSPIPKLTIKPIRPPTEDVVDDSINRIPSIPNVTKLNIKPIIKPLENDLSILPETAKNEISDQIPCITKLNIKPILKPPEKINDIHRKSSSSEISESEYSENDDSTGTSDQASISDQGSSETVPKVTIKLGKPGTESEGKFYTEQNIPKLTIKTIQQTDKDENESKLKLVISQSEEKSLEKVPKFTIKTVSKSESQPLSPKLTIKSIKPPESANSELAKLIISAEPCSSGETKDNMHVPKITIKPVTKTDADLVSKTKKSSAVCDSSEHIPLITKLNIKPIIKPEIREDAADLGDKVPVVSKLNIKPIVKPKEVDSSVEDVPKIIKLNIKPLKSPEGNSSEEKDCDDMKDEKDNSSIPIVTKLNIKPIVKPIDDACKDTRNETEENQSSETGNSSDENNDHIPIVTKLNIKPIVKPSEDKSKSEIEENIPVISKLNIKPIMKPESSSQMSPRKEQSKSDSEQIPVVTKLNIKPLIKPDDTTSPASPKRESTKPDMEQIPVVTKLNIKPIIRPEDTKSPHSPKKEDIEQNIPVVTKLNIKPLIKPEETPAPASPKKDSSKIQSIPVVTKLNIKPIVKPEEKNVTEIQNENLDKPVKNPPLVMKINMKNMSDNTEHDHNLFNNVEGAHSPKLSHSPKVDKSTKLESKSEKVVIVNNIESEKVDSNSGSPSVISGLLNTAPELNCAPETIASVSNENKLKSSQAQEGCSPRLRDFGTNVDSQRSQRNSIQINEIHETNNIDASLMKVSPEVKQASAKQRKSVQNCTLLKKLLSTTKDNLEKSQEVSNNLLMQCERVDVSLSNCNDNKHIEKDESDIQHSTEHSNDRDNKNSKSPEKQDYSKHRPIQVVCKEVNESVTRPLEISVNEKVSNQSSGQDSPRIILKINKTDHGASAKIITEDTHKVTISPVQQENTHETVHDKQSPKKQVVNSRRKAPVEETTDLSIGKRLRSSRIVENADKTPILRRNLSKRPSATETTGSPPNNEGELSVLDSKRLKLEQILSANKSLSITPIVKVTQISPTKATPEIRQGGKTVNQLTVNNENCPKNGNSKLHNILTNLQVKQMQSLQRNDSSTPERTIVTSEIESNTSTGSSDVVVEITRIDNCHPDVQEMMINENSDFRDMTTPEEISQDPLDTSKTAAEEEAPKAVVSTPQPRKRGRPRKIPLSEGPKEVTPVVTALEERPQRSLRLTRERPAILTKPRGRGRGRGRRVDTGTIQPRSPPAESPPPTETVIVIETLEEPELPRPATPVSPPIDPTSSRIKLPRMTEALDKSTNTCSTPLTTRRRSSLFGETSTDSNQAKSEEYMKSPEVTPRVGRGGRGSRGGSRGRTPRNRGRGRGGGRGATYMKETMGIYGRVCGPATTTVELFEEETCMMDDNATPSKPSHLLDEDSQSSVKSSTNDSSNKMKKSKFADIFDSSKVWTAADVKEYTWPPPESSTCENQVMMIQEQVAMFLGVKSFKRRYPELKRRPVVGEEKDYVLKKGVVTEALCDLGITAVDASEVLDIMLSDYPHKYEEYRSHQRQRQLTETETTVEVKQEEKPSKVDVKSEKTSDKPEPPKVDPEKARQEMAAAAIASALEWNARCNAWRRPACVDLQTMTVHRRRAPQHTPARPPPTHCRPPAGFYPHALLPGQFQHHYRTYTPEQLRYFPLNTVIAAPPAPPSPVESSSESEGSWGDSSSSSDDSDLPHHLSAKRKKLTKVKRSSQQDKDKEESRGASGSGSVEEPVDTCRVCKLRLEANRKYTHERFLVCANCNAKLHPSCLDLNADTIRKCREYAWQCAECKSCCACRKPQDDDKMLFCDLCDRGFHIYCVGLDRVPQGRWHCVECAICKSCGAREPEGLGAQAPAGATPAAGAPDAEWHHQTRRGPGGHKVYSHSLCTPCARAYRIGRYCPLCERSFIGPKGTMQLVICKLCDRQLHQECVRPLVSALNVLDYTCGECRRGGITSRAAAVRLAPRTIATLFMAKRRFNKYAHRQYMASRLLEQQQDDEEHEPDADADPDPDPGD